MECHENKKSCGVLVSLKILVFCRDTVYFVSKSYAFVVNLLLNLYNSSQVATGNISTWFFQCNVYLCVYNILVNLKYHS